MPSMAEHESASIVKMLVTGDSSSGKTGGLSSLVDAGLKLRVLDFDNGMSPIRGFVKDKAKLATHVNYVTLRDDFRMVAGRVGIKKASAFQDAMDALDKGTPFGADIGPLSSWGPDVVLCVDTLALAGRAALFMVMVANARGMTSPQLQDYGTAMESLERLLDMLTSDEVRCHVLVHTHTIVAEGTTKVFPEALGSKLGPKVGKFFDNWVNLSLTAGERTYKTKKDGLLALKTAVPIKDTYPIATGMADIFRDLLGKKDLV